MFPFVVTKACLNPFESSYDSAFIENPWVNTSLNTVEHSWTLPLCHSFCELCLCGTSATGVGHILSIDVLNVVWVCLLDIHD